MPEHDSPREIVVPRTPLSGPRAFRLGQTNSEILTSMELNSGRPHSDRAQLGAVYTPANLAQWVAKQMRLHSRSRLNHVLDPACGSGILLQGVRAEIPEVQRFTGYDLSSLALEHAADSFKGESDFREGDSLIRPKEEFSDIDGVIMNPPWGGKLTAPVDILIDEGYTLATGQFDTWDLFIEWSIRRLREGATVAAIIPDAIFLPEHAATRKLLADSTDIHLLARLGEGWFRGVYRGAVVTVFTVGKPASPAVNCVRLPHDRRKQVFRGEMSIEEAAKDTQQIADQNIWARDKEVRFIVPPSGTNSDPIVQIEQAGGDWTRLMEIGRGVEIGKSGKLHQCSNCGWHIPPPQRSAQTCVRCKESTVWHEVQAIANEPLGLDWRPLIVGEDVVRHQTAPSRWIQLGLQGIQYKDEANYLGPKLLVRKTGLGLNAAIDKTGSHTTQVVYHFRPTATAPAFYLEYVAGVLCSRVMLAYHLASSGETEWRSHPYVTPRMLKTLPIPLPQKGSPSWRQAQVIAKTVRGLGRAKDSTDLDLALDGLVAGLFGLDRAACDWVVQTIAATQNLRAFAALKLTAESSIEPEVAA